MLEKKMHGAKDTPHNKPERGMMIRQMIDVSWWRTNKRVCCLLWKQVDLAQQLQGKKRFALQNRKQHALFPKVFGSPPLFIISPLIEALTAIKILFRVGTGKLPGWHWYKITAKSAIDWSHWNFPSNLTYCAIPQVVQLHSDNARFPQQRRDWFYRGGPVVDRIRTSPPWQYIPCDSSADSIIIQLFPRCCLRQRIFEVFDYVERLVQ